MDIIILVPGTKNRWLLIMETSKKCGLKFKRQKSLSEYIKNNPFLTDEELARILRVSVQTIRLDRAELKIPELRERIKKLAKGNIDSVKSLSCGELVGELLDILIGEKGTSILTITRDMVFKKNLIARGHHLFAQANSLAVAVVDAAIALTGSVKASFKKPVKLGERVIAEARIISAAEKRYKVSVLSKVRGDKVFEGTFIVFAITGEESLCE